MSWRDSLRPASFRGVPFKVEASTKAGGRRGVTFEFPRRDTPADEDLGRRARRYAVTGYLVGENHHFRADALERALSASGPGTLILPLMGAAQVRCETFARTERRQEGGLTSFEMAFAESSMTTPILSLDTGSAVEIAARAAEAAVSFAADKSAAQEAPLPPPNRPVSV